MSIPGAQPTPDAGSSSIPKGGDVTPSASSSIPSGTKRGASSSIPSADPTRGRSIPSAAPTIPHRRDRARPDPDPKPEPDPQPPPLPPIPPHEGGVPEDMEDWIGFDSDIIEELRKRKREAEEKIYLNFMVWLQTQEEIKDISDELGLGDEDGEILSDKIQREGLEKKIDQFIKKNFQRELSRPIRRRIFNTLERKAEAIGNKVREFMGKRAGEFARRFPKLLQRYQAKVGRASSFGLGLDIGTALLSKVTHSRISELHQLDDIFGNIPVVNSFYNATVQLGETILHAFGVPTDKQRRKKQLQKRYDFLKRYSEELGGKIKRTAYWENKRETNRELAEQITDRSQLWDRQALLDAYEIVDSGAVDENTPLSEIREIAERHLKNFDFDGQLAGVKNEALAFARRIYWIANPNSHASRQELKFRRENRRFFITPENISYLHDEDKL